MKIFLAVFVGMLFYANVALATVNMDLSNIKSAQEYGIMRYQESFFNFAKQWIVFEEKSKTVDEQGERIYVYTPFYLVALNARDRLLAGQTINVYDGQVVLDAWQGSLPISVVFYVQDLVEINDGLEAKLLQGDKSLPAFDFSVQNTMVVQTKVVREPIQVQIISDGSEKKQDGTQQVEKQADSKEEQNSSQLVIEQVNFIEKTVPALYRVQIFFYFDLSQLDLNTPAVFVVKPNSERERKFNFSFADMD